MESEIVVAISQRDKLPWNKIRKIQEETWIRKYEAEAKIIHYLSLEPPILVNYIDRIIEKYRFAKKFGRLSSLITRLFSYLISSEVPKYKFNVANKELLVHSYSTYFLFGRRNLALYDWFISNTNSKFLFQTNTSSYLDIVKLISITKKMNCKDLILAGAIVNPNSQNFKIISGAGRLLSRELITEILKHKNSLKFDNLEDICISELASKLSATIIPLDRYDLPTINKLNSSSDSDLKAHFHFRCKSESLPRSDDNIMNALYTRLSKLL